MRFTAIDGHVWKSTWLLRRARDLANGKLQGVSMILHNETLNEVFPDNKITKILEKIKTLVGLDFKQFTKSVILAQGDFQAFLNASDTDRAQILEKLTGTEVYSEISKGIYEKNQQIKNDFIQIEQQINALHLLNDEDLDALKKQIENTEKALKKLDTDANQLQTYETWYKTESDLQTQLTRINQQIELVETKLQQLKPEIELLKQVENIQDIKPLVTENIQAQKRLTETENEINGLIQQSKTLAKQKDEIVQTLEKEKDQHKNLLNQATANEPLYKKAREIDVLLKKASEVVAELQTNAKNNADEIANFQLQLKNKKAETSAKKTALDAIQAWFTTNQKVKNWAANASLLQNQLQQVQQTQNQIKALLEEHQLHIANAQKTNAQLLDLEAKKTEITNKLDVINAAINPKKENLEKQDFTELITKQKDWQTQTDVLKDLYQIAVEYDRLTLQKQKTEQDIKTAEQDFSEANNQLTEANKQIEQIKQQHAHQTIYVDKLKLENSANVLHLRSQLQPGCACPVCGSSQHEINQVEVVTSLVEKAIADLNVLDVQKNETLALQTRLETCLKYTAEVIANLKVSYNEQQLEHNLCIDKWTKKVPTSAPFSIQNATNKADLEQELIQINTSNKALAQQIAAATELQKEIVALENSKQQLQNQLEIIGKEINQLQIAQETHKNKLEEIKNNGDKLRKTETASCQQIDAILNQPNWLASFKQNALVFIENISTQISAWNENIAKEEGLKTEWQNLVNETEKIDSILKEKEKTYTDLQQKIANETQFLNQHKAERILFFDGQAIDIVEQALKQQTTKQLDTVEKLLADEKIVENNLVKCQTSVLEKNEQLTKTQQNIAKNKAEIERFITNWNTQNELHLDADKLFNLCAYNNEWLVNTRKNIDATLQEKANILGAQKTVISQIEKHQTTNKPELDVANIALKKQELLLAKEEHNEILLADKTKLLNHNNNIDAQKNLIEKRNTLEPDYLEWQELNNLLGSASGDRLKKLAQQFTLDLLLQAANAQLQQINNRYILERIDDSLSILVIDQYMANAKRATNSLSGGETFLVSLALSLALSTISSTQLQVESLFIDEGFGSLDPNSLETAFLALENLQNQGRMIGIISHLDAVIDRLAVKIQVTPQGNGKSKIQVTA
ncbi:hypothetical protein K5I29_03160 [Flavobacterium agricola]|uniref:Exonuclease SbcC n=1 Tax=Flavobacterium agricola TaxID=2870839 RepID=A0ABY6M483_9FLAO|nr:SbcC/MukB-like Walker B domain-containing protein [Flavobacterium agricola]UYW01928.1 hypothetical protein K5I29_03160 [Flavobacterium agricola]